jgi:ferric-dicitrate binding protein FerR (iron transport regulator)
MPKDTLDALIERLERESEQHEQAWAEVERTFEQLPPEERRQRKEEFQARFIEYLKRHRDLASKMMLAFEALEAPPPEKLS